MRFLWALLVFSLPLAAEPDVYQPIQLASDPALSPDGSQIYFSYRGDIWTASVAEGLATRLTQHPAFESRPLISADGRTLYFNSSRSGTTQVHRRQLDGGPAEQLTFHSEGARLESLAADELSIIISGYRDQAGGRAPRRLVRVRVDTESPEEILFDDYGEEGQLSPDGQRLLFTRDGERIYRKGYVGPRASKVWHYDMLGGDFEKLIATDTETRTPIWAPDVSGFYHTAVKNGVSNIAFYDFSSKQSRFLTSHSDENAIMLQMSADGSTLVYRKLFDFYLLLTAENATPQKLELFHNEDIEDEPSETRTITSTSDADFTESGLEIVFSSDGEIFAMDTVLREPKRLTETPAYEEDVVFSPDGQSIYYVRDDGVDRNIYKATRKDPSVYWWQTEELEHTAITLGAEPKSAITLSPKGEKMAYLSGEGDIWVSDLDGNDARRVVANWARPSFAWSPDGKWLTYSATDPNFNIDVFIVPIDSSMEPVNISRHPDSETGPAWSPDGKLIAFSGKRHGEAVDIFIVRLTNAANEETERDRKREEALKKMEKDELYKKKEEPTEEKKEEKEEEPAEESEEEPAKDEEAAEEEEEDEAKEDDSLQIDFENLHERFRRYQVSGSPRGLHWSHDSKTLYYRTGSDLHSLNPNDGKTDRVTGDAGHILRIDEDKKIYWISNNAPAVFHKKKNTRYTFRTNYERDRKEHRRQAFRRVWRTMRDRFYDPALNNRDWPAVLQKLEAVAASAPTTSEFDHVAEMLLGELNASHMGFTPSGSAYSFSPRGAKGLVTRHLGAFYDRSEKSGGLHISSILPNSPAAQQKSLLSVGDQILSINGTKVDFSTPLPAVLTGRLDEDIVLQVRSAGGEERSVTLRGISYSRARSLARDAQLDGNAELVDKLSDGKIGYIHVARMAWPEFEEFERQIFERGYGKDGLIIDVRDNGGGFTADHLLTVLTPPRFTYTIPRGGSEGYPHSRRVYATWHKPVVVLCNQHSYSNAEIFSHAIKDLGRGKVVGVPTAGGVISTGSASILDYGQVRLPFRGWFLNRNGEDMELYPAVPHVIVWPDIGTANTADDLQLKTAIEVMSEEVKAAKAKAAAPAKYRSQHPIK